jgi:hypothetical protein
VQLEGLGRLKKFNDLIGSQTDDFPVCSIVPRPTTLPHADNNIKENGTAFQQVPQRYNHCQCNYTSTGLSRLTCFVLSIPPQAVYILCLVKKFVLICFPPSKHCSPSTYIFLALHVHCNKSVMPENTVKNHLLKDLSILSSYSS